MIIFIDESGDAGFKIQKGSSKTFVIVLIIFDDELDAEETALKIKKFRRENKKKDSFEFKFNKTPKTLKINFLKIVRNCKFRARAIVFQKEKIYSPNLRSSKDSFYNYAIKLVLEHNNDTIFNAKVRLDRLGERSFRQNLTTYLRKSLNQKERKIMKNLRFRNSKNDVLIQLADMIAGSVRKFYDKDKNDYQEYFKIIKLRIEDIWEFK